MKVNGEAEKTASDMGFMTFSNFIMVKRIEWLGQVLQMDDNKTPKITLLARMFCNRRKG